MHQIVLKGLQRVAAYQQREGWVSDMALDAAHLDLPEPSSPEASHSDYLKRANKLSGEPAGLGSNHVMPQHQRPQSYQQTSARMKHLQACGA